MAPTGIKYRPDIDGLRAIAVLSVVLYHFGIGGLQGGFIGVDVFFVISGYLITGIIRSEMQDGQFTLAGFYERRARRIFPALFAMLLGTMVAGLWMLLPSDLARLGQAAMATILFVSNGLYYTQSGYFDDAADFNALLHTWSLGVEEQFYLGLPLLMLLVARLRGVDLRKVLVFSALASFVACVVVQPLNFKATFFLSPFRAWELLLGSLLGIGAVPRLVHPVARHVLGVLALGALAGSIAFMGGGIDFPGWKAALPVLATASVIHVGSSGGSAVTKLLAWKPLVFVGLISYSLYLWHWPLLVFAQYRIGMEPLSQGTSLVLLAITLALAAASYYAIERPFRKSGGRGGRTASPRQVFAVSGVAALALVAAGFAFTKGDGFPSRVSASVATLDRARSPEIPFRVCDHVLPEGDATHCQIGSTQLRRPVALIWGDSHALAWAPAMDEVLNAQGMTGILSVYSACAPLLGLHNPKAPNCREHNDRVAEWIERKKPDRIYLIAAWFGYSNTRYGYDLSDVVSGATGNERIFGPALGRTIERLRPHVNQIVVIGPTPGAVDALPYRLALARWRHGSPPLEVTLAEYRDQARSFWAGTRPHAGKVELINPEAWFCSDGRCRYSDGDQMLYRDGHHLNAEGARFVARHLLAAEGIALGAGQTATSGAP